MSRLAAVPGWDDSGSPCQYVEIAEPGEPGYPTPRLPDGDPWAPAVNRVIDEIAGEAEPVPYTLTPRAEAVLASWDRFRALGEAERLALSDPEAEPEWDCEDSNACQARVEAGLEPEAEL